MQAAPARYVSVSELYSTDEVELLLDEIRELEPTSCRGEDVQDFEIAGSGCGGVGAGAGGGRSPASLTERSWDSHAQYRRAARGARAAALAPLYCRARHLLTARGALRLLLVLACAAACAAEWAALGLRLGRAPLAARPRLLLLAALSSLLLHAALLLLHVTRLTRLLPLDWDALGAAAGAWSAASLGAGGALTLHALLAAPEYRWAPASVSTPLLTAAALGLAGSLLALGLTARGAYAWLRARGAYRAVPAAPEPDAPL